MIEAGTYKADALLVVDEADERIPGMEIAARMPTAPVNISRTLKHLHEDGYVDRESKGVSGDPYRYDTTSKGEAAATDLRESVEYDADDAGLSALGFDVDESVTGDDADEDDDADVEGTYEAEDMRVDAIEERVSAIEDAVGTNNVAREDIKHRLRQLETAIDRFDDADHVVTFDDKEFVEMLIVIGQSDYGGKRKKRHLIATLTGIEDPEEKGLIARALSAASSKTSEDMSQDKAADTDQTERQ